MPSLYNRVAGQSVDHLAAKLLFLIAAGLALPISLSPQSWSQPQQPSSASTPPETTPTSTVFITARSKAGSPVELSASDLELKADGKPASIRDVHRVSGIALDYAILFDSSGSERAAFELQKDEAVALLSKVVQAGRDHGILVSFNDKAYVDADSANPQDLVKALAKSSPRGGTALYDAILASADDMSKSRSNSDPVLHVMFILSDGEDNASRVTLDGAVQTALRAGIRIYAIGERTDPDKPHNTARATSALKEFAQRTGGKVYLPGKNQDATKIAADIADELTNLFAVTYTLPQQKSDGQLHKLEFKSNKKGVSLTAPDRYSE
jgi:Ca-activated chloride channel family protein